MTNLDDRLNAIEDRLAVIEQLLGIADKKPMPRPQPNRGTFAQILELDPHREPQGVELSIETSTTKITFTPEEAQPEPTGQLPVSPMDENSVTGIKNQVGEIDKSKR